MGLNLRLGNKVEMIERTFWIQAAIFAVHLFANVCSHFIITIHVHCDIPMSSQMFNCRILPNRSVCGWYNTHTQIYNNYEDLLKQCQDVWMSLNASSIRKMAIRKVVCLDYISLHMEGCLEKEKKRNHMKKTTNERKKNERLIEFIFCVSFYKSLHVRFSFFSMFVIAFVSVFFCCAVRRAKYIVSISIVRFLWWRVRVSAWHGS